MLIGELFVKLTADPSGIRTGVNRGVQELSRLESGTVRATTAMGGTTNAANKLRGGLLALATQATGANPALARLASVLSLLAVGGPVTVGVLLGIAAIGFAWNKFTKDAREAREETEKLVASLVKAREERHAASIKGMEEKVVLLQAELTTALKAQAGLKNIGSRLGAPGKSAAAAVLLAQENLADQQKILDAAKLAAQTLDGLTVEVSNTAAQVADVFRNLATEVRVAAETFKLLGGGQELTKVQLSAMTSTLQELLKLGVDPASKGVQDLAAQIRMLTTLMEDVGKREIKIPLLLTGISRFEMARINPPGQQASGGALEALAPLLGQLTGAFQSLMASLGPMAVVGEFLNGVFAALAPVIDALMVPIRNIGFLVGSVIAPLLKVLQPILDAVAKAFSFVIQAVGYLVKGLGKFLDALPLLGDFGLIKAGQSMIDLAKETRRQIDAGVDMTRTMEKITASASNVPQIFDLLARRRDAGMDLSAPSGSEIRNAKPRGGMTVNIVNPPASVDPVAVAKQVERAILERARMGGTTEFMLAVQEAG